MFLNRNNIKTILVFFAGFFLAGLIFLGISLLFCLKAAGCEFSADNISDLYQKHNEIYLLNLLPLITSITGVIAGRKFYDIRKTSSGSVEYYKSVLNNVVEFAECIESRNFERPFVAVNGEKVLEKSMESMRKSLIATSRREFERNEINRISNEISIVLHESNDLNRLCEETVSFLVKKIDKVVQGAFYIVEDEGLNDKMIVLKASYAYDRKRYLNAKFRFAQGLVGQAAVEKDIIYRTEIPDDYVTIKSGLLGHAKPRSLIISPLISNDTVYGVVELGAFSNLTPFQLTIIEEISKIIARSVANVKANQKTYELLSESEKMRSELSSQKKQLVKNTEELIKTQKDLEEANAKLHEQMMEVYNTNKRSQVLLENAKEVITIFSEEEKIIYVSPSIKSIMGYFPEELLDKNAAENVHPQDSEKFNTFLKELISFPEKESRLQYRYFTKNGDVIWMEATGKNLISDSVIKGLVVNSSDISEQRNAAKEQRIRAKMQALSENSSDLIIRVDIFGRCTYINPVIEQYTGKSKEYYINKQIGNTEIYPSVVTILKQLLEQTSVSKNKKSVEMEFPAPDGIRIMQVNAIPEFNELGDAESVLYACHDITEAKQREEIIRKKNKSISDSINYALNIQSALMPKEEDIRRLLPNSFMIYRPKDIVSGDYPWLFKKDDSIFIGAMDCTGHGVPGAMMSIIGYFLQDSILHQDENLNAGDILNRLHTEVVLKLKQAEPGSKINDGMDAAFCKIDMKKGKLHFAGAHRPLYHVSKGVLTEIKGDKYPVGSTQYRNRKDFINNTISITKGDAVYFMTDGYPDQFGGPTGKQRFTSEGVANLIRENTGLSIFQMGDLFNSSYDNWKGEINQLDDVLVIGIKF